MNHNNQQPGSADLGLIEQMGAALRECASALAYAAFNVDGKTLEQLDPRLMESTGVSDTCLIAERAARAALFRAKRAALARSAPAVEQSAEKVELIELLRAIRPNYGAVGSRDIDVTAQRARIDRAIELLSGAAPVSAGQAVQVACPCPNLDIENYADGSAGCKGNCPELAVPVSPPDGAMPEQMADSWSLVATIMGKLDEYGMAVKDHNDDWRSRVRVEIRNLLLAAQPAEGSAQVARPNDELIRLFELASYQCACWPDTYQQSDAWLAFVGYLKLAAPERSDTPVDQQPISRHEAITNWHEKQARIDSDKQGAQGDAS